MSHPTPPHRRCRAGRRLVAATPPAASAPTFAPYTSWCATTSDASRADRAAHPARHRHALRRATCPAAPARSTIEDGDSVAATLAELRRRAATSPTRSRTTRSAPRTRASCPNDPGRERRAGDWRDLQWNFFGPSGVNAPIAWESRARGRRAGRPRRGRRGDRLRRRLRAPSAASAARPTSTASRFVKPYDFVENDRHPNDEESHGTHVTGTIAQKTNNGIGVTGLAYGVKIMPLRVLERRRRRRALRHRARASATPPATAPT